MTSLTFTTAKYNEHCAHNLIFSGIDKQLRKKRYLLYGKLKRFSEICKTIKSEGNKSAMTT